MWNVAKIWLILVTKSQDIFAFCFLFKSVSHIYCPPTFMEVQYYSVLLEYSFTSKHYVSSKKHFCPQIIHN